MIRMETSETRHTEGPQGTAPLASPVPPAAPPVPPAQDAPRPEGGSEGRLSPQKHIAVVTMGVKLCNEQRGYTRFRKIAELLVDAGYRVDLITSSFQHWDKAQRNTADPCYYALPYRVIFIEEPGYAKNLDLARIRSHAKAAKNLRTLLATTAGPYDLIYAEIPPNDVARVCAEFASENGIPFIADINDLWPEAMRMVLNVPLVSTLAFWPFARDAKAVYRLLSGAVGTSDEYAARPAADRKEPYLHETVYVGNDLAAFDAGAKERQGEAEKGESEFWVTYAGTLGASYDLKTLIEAAALLNKKAASEGGLPAVRVKLLGDGPDREALEATAKSLDAPVDFLGYRDYDYMAAFLCASDVLVNSLKKDAAQSIVTKIGDYLASGKPMINTGSSKEFRAKVDRDGFGVNVEAGDPEALAEAIAGLYRNDGQRQAMGEKGRKVAEAEFDQQHSYQKIVDLIRRLTEEPAHAR